MTKPGERYYQLTHDYLVHSLRDWLTRKQRETRRGRAELRLAERSASWNAKPENRHLPSALEWANIRLLTKKAGLDRPPKADDEACGSSPRLEGTGTGDPDRPDDLGRDRGLRKAARLGSGRVAEDRQHDGCPGSHRTTQELPPLGWSSTLGIVVEYRERPRSTSPGQPRQPRLVARRRQPGRLSLRPSPVGFTRRIAGDLGHLAQASSGDRQAAVAISG